MSETTNTEPVEIEVHVGRDPEDEDPREETLVDHLAAIEAMCIVPGVPHSKIAERCFDAMCCGAKAEHLPFIGNDEVLALALIDLLFAKIADAREADAVEARGEPQIINTNDEVWVRLSPRGESIARHSNYPSRARGWRAGKWIREQLWVLMLLFGDHYYMGVDPPFQDNVIALTDPTTTKET